MASSDPGWVFFVLFPPFFVGFWCLVCFAISFFGGWRELAEKFPGRKNPTGKVHSMESASFGLVNYSSCLTVRASKEGVDLAVWLPFRIGHAPIFLPWAELGRITHERFLFFRRVRIELGSPTIASIRISRRLYEDLKEQA